MGKTKISTLSAILITLSIVVSYVSSSLPRTFINETKSATLLNIVYITIVVLIIILFFCKLFNKFPGQDLLDVSEFLGGKLLKNIIGSLFIFYFIVSSSLMLRNFCEALVVVYYPITNHIFIILMFIIAVGFTNKLGFNSTVNTASIAFPLVLISVILLFFGNFDNFSFNKIYPILGDGFKETFVIGLKNIGAFGGICYMYFLPPLLEKPEKLKKIAVISVLFTGLFILLCVGTLLFIFSFYTSSNETMPLFLAARKIEFGEFFQRFESLFLLIWIISFCCYLSISVKFATHIFNKMFNLSDKSIMLNIFLLLILGVSLLPKELNFSEIFERDIYRYMRIIIGFISGLTVLIFANLKKKAGEHY